jgi:hypothetical protein
VVTGLGYALPFLVLAGVAALAWTPVRRLRQRVVPD